MGVFMLVSLLIATFSTYYEQLYHKSVHNNKRYSSLCPRTVWYM